MADAPACTVVAKPQPFGESVFAHVQAGQTLAQMLGKGVSGTCRVTIGGEPVPQALWAHVRPKAGQVIHVVRFPEGGGGGNKWLRTVALVVVAYLSYGVGSGTLGGLTGGYAAAAGAAVGIIGNIAVNSLIPAPQPTAGAANASPYDQLASLTGTSNQASPYGVIPCVVGTMVFYPPHAALPYTEISGDDQYLRMLLDLGYAGPGGMDVSQIQISGTDISTFTDAEWEISTQPSLFMQDVFELAVGVTLDPNSTTIRTTDGPVSEISVDFIFPNGLFAVNSDGDFVNAWQFVTIDFAVSGTDTWYGVAPPTAGITISNPDVMQSYDLSEYKITSSANKTLRVGIRWKVPGNQQWDVRVKAGTAGWDSSVQRSTTMQWSVMRSFHPNLPSLTDSNKLALRIKATDQLNGVISSLSVRAAQLIRTQDSSGNWLAPAECQNPAWIDLWLKTECPAVQKRLPDARINLSDTLAWAEECTARGYKFSTVLDSARTLYDIAKDVLASGRATFGMRNGLYAPVRDVNQAVPVQMFTPANSWNFQFSRTFTNPPDAIKVTFTNPEAGYQQDVVVVYRPGVTAATAVLFDQLDLPFVPDPIAAAKIGYYHLLVTWSRATQYTWNADVEHIVCERGDLVTHGHDVTQAGIAFGYVKAVNGRSLQLDSTLVLDPAKQYAIRVRHFTNAQDQAGLLGPITWDSTAITFDNDQITFDSGSYDGAPLGYITMAKDMTVSPGDLYVLCEVGSEVLPLLVTDIAPGADLSAQISAVDQALAVYAADTWVPPAFVSQITGQPWNKKPPVPDVLVRIGGSSPDGVGVVHTTGGTSGTGSGGVVTPPRTCVTVDALMQDGRRADAVKVGDTLELADEQTLAPASGAVSLSEGATAWCVEITTQQGVVLRCSTTAPIPTRRGCRNAPDVAGCEVAVWMDGQAAPTWDSVRSVRALGEQRVQHITCNNGCFWARSEGSPGLMLHHNAKMIPRDQGLAA